MQTTSHAAAAPRTGEHSPSMLCSPLNVGFAERWGSLVGGAALAVAGFLRRSPLGFLMTVGGGYLAYRGYSGHCAVYEAAGVSTVSQPAVEVKAQFTVLRSPEEVYRFWKDFANLPRFMKHLARVTVTGPGHSHWVVSLPLGRSLEWDAVIVEDCENRCLRWESVPGGDVQTVGQVEFKKAPGDRGTEVRMRIEYRPPLGLLGETAAWIARPFTAQQIREDLRRFKRLIETGEIPTIDGQPSGREEPRPDQVCVYERRRPQMERARSQTGDEAVVEASAESFPASDSPGWGPATIGNRTK